MNNIENILIVGGDGFLGWNLYTQLKPLYNVFVLEKNVQALKRLNDEVSKSGIFDLNNNDLQEILVQNKIEIIINAAVDYGINSKPSGLYYNNVIFPMQLIESAVKNKIEYFFTFDSFFNKPENWNYSYLRPYILSKKHLEDALSLYENEVKIINFKLEHIFGINDNPNKFVPTIINQILTDAEIKLSSGEQKRDFIFASDVADLIIHIINHRPDIGQLTLSVGEGKSRSIREFVETVHKLTSSDARLLFGALEQREGEISESKADITLLGKIGWKPKHSFIDALSETINFEKDRKESL